jgi:hypothetical protein
MSALQRATFDRVCASIKFGTAIAARIAMIATTISNSIKVKPKVEGLLRIAVASLKEEWI